MLCTGVSTKSQSSNDDDDDDDSFADDKGVKIVTIVKIVTMVKQRA